MNRYCILCSMTIAVSRNGQGGGGWEGCGEGLGKVIKFCVRG